MMHLKEDYLQLSLLAEIQSLREKISQQVLYGFYFTKLHSICKFRRVSVQVELLKFDQEFKVLTLKLSNLDTNMQLPMECSI